MLTGSEYYLSRSDGSHSILRFYYGIRYWYSVGYELRKKHYDFDMVGYYGFFLSILCYFAWSWGRLLRYWRGFAYHPLVVFWLGWLSPIFLYLALSGLSFTSEEFGAGLGMAWRKTSLIYLVIVFIIYEKSKLLAGKDSGLEVSGS